MAFSEPVPAPIAGAGSLLAPAVHPEHPDDYFGAFVRDPHGINLEAVCHG